MVKTKRSKKNKKRVKKTTKKEQSNADNKWKKSMCHPKQKNKSTTCLF